MKNFLKLFYYFIILFIFLNVVFVFSASASTTDGTIDSAYKYAWGENTGWINFGTVNGNVHVTDSGMTGYALSETVGWINLNNIINDGAGNLSGYAWSENTGWIKFNPTNGGVIINSSGEFTGSALSETIGWIIFGGDYKVKTDWRPRSARPACNNASDDDGDGKTDYPADPGCSSLVDVDETDPVAASSGGGGLPPQAYNPPASPQTGFKISINQGADYTDSFTVNLSFIAGQDTARMSVSESSDFINGIQIPYQKELKWELLPILGGQISKQGVERIVYVKFYTQYGVSSQVYSDSIIIIASLPVIPAPSASPKISPQPSPEVAAGEPTLSPQVSLPPEDIPVPEISSIPTPAPYFETPREKPEPVNLDWNLIDTPEVKNFSPQPNEVSFFTQKFSSLSETFKDLGISKTSDIASRAPAAGFSIPNLWEIFELQSPNSNINSINSFQPTPLADLSVDLKKQIPSEISFVSAVSEKINFNSVLVLDDGSLKQKISVSASTNLNIALKPEYLTRSISGYIALKKSAYSINSAPQDLSFQDESSSFLIPLVSAEEIKFEQRFVLAQFQYADSDKDGIWTADIQTPAVIGEYEIISLINYQDLSIPPREIRLIAVIDPEGYVFRKEADGIESRIPGAVVSIYWLNSANNQYELWPAQNFDQKNPQTTDATGKYSFLVPVGSYYLKAEARGYHSYQSDIFVVSEANNVHLNLELVPDWSLIKEWKTILLILFGIALAYNFYRDRRRRS